MKKSGILIFVIMLTIFYHNFIIPGEIGRRKLLFNLLVDSVKSKDQLLFDSLKTIFNLTMDFYSPDGYTVLEKACQDRHSIHFVLKNKGDVNIYNIHNMTVFDKIIWKLIDKHSNEPLIAYYESFVFLDLHGAVPHLATWQEFCKAKKNLIKYWLPIPYTDILL